MPVGQERTKRETLNIRIKPELRAVCRHEASHRNRRTILNRAQQLLEGAQPDRPVG